MLWFVEVKSWSQNDVVDRSFEEWLWRMRSLFEKKKGESLYQWFKKVVLKKRKCQPSWINSFSLGWCENFGQHEIVANWESEKSIDWTAQFCSLFSVVFSILKALNQNWDSLLLSSAGVEWIDWKRDCFETELTRRRELTDGRSVARDNFIFSSPLSLSQPPW